MRTLAGQTLQQDMAEAIAPALRAIAASIGPDGRHVIYATGNRISSARTGSEIARHICSDHFAERLLKEALVDAERQFGDGTARLAVMAGAALAERRRPGALEARNERIIEALADLRPALDAAFAAETRICDATAELVAAAGVEPALASLILEADEVAGPDGLVEVKEAAETAVIAGLGFSFDARHVGAGTLAAMDDVHLIVANEVLSDFRTLAPVIEGFAARGKALVIAARGVEGQALQLIERNRQACVLKIAALVPADAGPRAAEILEDLAAATGATLVCALAGTRIDMLKPAMLGKAARFHIERGRVHLASADGCAERIALRIAAAEAEIRAKRYLPLDREHAERRRARLFGRWAELTVAKGPDSAAQVETVRRAIAALRAARIDGVIVGGGCGLERIADRLKGAVQNDPARRAATAMVDAALRAPGQCLRRNSTGLRQRDAVSAPVADPARLSRDLLDVALSLATRLAGIDGAVLRH
ncbi:chaperonin GroEL (HSP60 family) [Mycoplana sp. BE70]|uniref:TCP-1/cpn60 chaperonin family protein n=1 Tax=Mycoplana sp. BE70 TaxID=2817775 RepID=UPI00285591FA|nr:TCP-1/cpn60 chaperonin family protein [Mycoplana sp. BE70]MDR6759313.1 chaperonin GroEL (HSP60 family) [Mycoplana sp. BE70]